VVRVLETRLARPLPGMEAQGVMGRRPRPGPELPCEHVGGVLVILFPREGIPRVVLTVRAAHLRRHQGEVAFPGGRVEAGEQPLEAALREAEEEIGLSPASARVLGPLSPLPMPRTGFVLHPFVAALPSAPAMAPSDYEVDRILEVPLPVLAHPALLRRERRRIGEAIYEVPYFDVAGVQVWGATAMILAELLWILGAPVDPSS
jgi:8-oxo-dGTP pyrophosphatase MutT (NUDIX family)